jgi:hypothetical protein
MEGLKVPRERSFRTRSLKAPVRPPLGISLLVVAALTASPAVAQSTNYSRADATSGVAVQLNFHASANKNCSPAPPPRIRVLEIPKYGTLTVRKGEATVNSIPGCQAFKTTAEVIIYRSRPGYVGQDRLVYEMTSVNGEVATFNITVDVKMGAQTPPKRQENPI